MMPAFVMFVLQLVPDHIAPSVFAIVLA